MAIDEGFPVTTRLLTLLNVSATKTKKRKRVYDDPKPTERLNKRRSVTVQFSTDEETVARDAPDPAAAEDEPNITVQAADDEEQIQNVEDDAGDPYEEHFGAKTAVLTETAREVADRRAWKTAREKYGRLGLVEQTSPEGSTSSRVASGCRTTAAYEKLKAPFIARQTKLPQELVEMQNDLSSMLSSQKDLYITRTSLDTQASMRESITLHALNHITKSSKSGTPQPEDVQDQGFTRPSVLILLPFRSFAVKWAEYDLPPGAVDKLASAEPGTYPRDHVEMFQGNVDDSFRVGVKLTRKSVKLFADFTARLGCGCRSRRKSGLLSSIEVLVVDQMDALTMQNWEHIQYLMSRLNQLPKESHDVDFSRIKPWYLDGCNAAYLRQTILLTAYETPETRSLFNVRTIRRWSPVDVPRGLTDDIQNFVQFDCLNLKDEAEKRLSLSLNFRRQMLPAVLKSAVQSANTVIFIPSSFDFIRVHNYFKKNVGYTSNQDISRARQAFFSGKKAMLLISERFHFYRRYKIRGTRNLLLSYPFLDEGVEASDVTCRVLYSKYDWLRLERVAGTEGAAELIKGDAR
ncbi:digestive organ expansion factor [Amylocystis lapponica]|nr:digestive organ expansion factor [Amylocystis lapponica]